MINKTNLNNNHEITKRDIKNMRKCDVYIPEYFTRDYIAYSQIRLIKRGKSHIEGWEGIEDQSYNIPVNVKFELYSTDDISIEYGQDPRKCQAYLTNYNHVGFDHLRAIAQILRVNDILTLVWEFSDGNQYLKESITDSELARGQKLYQSKVYLQIERGSKTRMRFLIDSSVCPTNSAAIIQL